MKYESVLDLRETERAIKLVKDFFQTELARALSLQRVSAPLMAKKGTGVNDDLSGKEGKVTFSVPDDEGAEAEIVLSLAKWKRMALADYGFPPGEGLYTDMNAIRPEEGLSEIHSIYVDQWDWEKIILPEQRTLGFLRQTVRSIYGVIRKTEIMIHGRYPEIVPALPEEIHFVHTEDLRKRYPDLSPRDREERVAEEKGAVFLIGIGSELGDGRPHDDRAPDYDDWITDTGKGRGLNGDIIVWHPTLERAVELSSMGIRVDRSSLLAQLRLRGKRAGRRCTGTGGC